MKDVAVQKVKELDTSIRAWLQLLFGRPVGEDESITVLLFPPHHEPSGAARVDASTRMKKVLAEMDQHSSRQSDSDIEDAIDEAMDQVRRWKE